MLILAVLAGAGGKELADAVVQGDGVGGADTRGILWYPTEVATSVYRGEELVPSFTYSFQTLLVHFCQPGCVLRSSWELGSVWTQ